MTLQIAELSPLAGTVGKLTSVGADLLQAPSRYSRADDNGLGPIGERPFWSAAI
jgi:hypothetical protein